MADKLAPGEQAEGTMEYNNLKEADGGDKSEDIKWGDIYEIDHAHLPPTAPAHLHRIRAARVWKKTAMDIEVRFPSMENLNTYVYRESLLPHPALHEKYVMDLAVATKVLVRRVPGIRLTKQHTVKFWLISEMEAEQRKNEVKLKDKESNDNLKRKGCSFSYSTEGKTKKAKLDLISKEQRTCSSSEHAHLVREETAQVETDETVFTREEVLQALKVRDGSFQTITWPKLSAEVRKKIADTGLLDHIPGFKRRHNPDGTMEYWVDLESDELVNLIKTRDDDNVSTAGCKPSAEFRSSNPFVGWKSTTPTNWKKPCDTPTNWKKPCDSPAVWNSSDNPTDWNSPVWKSRDNTDWRKPCDYPTDWRKPGDSTVFRISSDNPTDWRSDSPTQDPTPWILLNYHSKLKREKKLLKQEIKMVSRELQEKYGAEPFSSLNKSAPYHPWF